ncbi:MAG: hypothetical protein LBM13_00580 [Candidatus Ancillula sp.]|jgi:cell division protein FtsB|nr:hypothetical protein [Candidatus Ancillula sp.]
MDTRQPPRNQPKRQNFNGYTKRPLNQTKNKNSQNSPKVNSGRIFRVCVAGSILLAVVIMFIFLIIFGVKQFQNYQASEAQKAAEEEASTNNKEGVDCAENDVKIDAVSKKNTFLQSDGKVVIKVDFKNITDHSCKITLSENNQSISVVSGKTAILDTEKCVEYTTEQGDYIDKGVLLGTNDSYSTEVTWDMKGPDKNSCPEADIVKKGNYMATVSYLKNNIKSNSVNFTIG